MADSFTRATLHTLVTHNVATGLPLVPVAACSNAGTGDLLHNTHMISVGKAILVGSLAGFGVLGIGLFALYLVVGGRGSVFRPHQLSSSHDSHPVPVPADAEKAGAPIMSDGYRVEFPSETKTDSTFPRIPAQARLWSQSWDSESSPTSGMKY